MSEQLLKLSPDRDLQCYFLTPSAIAAMSQATPSGFTVSGKWRQQFDWAVVEWNRDNTFEHPVLRNLPDGDLTGLVLTYQEQRTGCIPIESNLYPIVDWPSLRIWWDDESGNETVTKVPLWPNCAVPLAGTYVPASCTMQLIASPGVGQRVGVAFLDSHHYYVVQTGDTLQQIAEGIAADVNSNPDFSATSNGTNVVITWKNGPNWPMLRGANANRITAYGFAEGGPNCWAAASAPFTGGQFPSTYQITIDFGSLLDQNGNQICKRVRKLRWTWAADLQPGMFDQTEFSVRVSNWSVTGTGRTYSVAGPGSRRMEDADGSALYAGVWDARTGNYSGGRIHHTNAQGSSVTIEYSETASHSLYLGTRLLASGANVAVSLDGAPAAQFSTQLAGEDVLVRKSLGTIALGEHSITITHAGPDGTDFFFDFLEIAYPSQTLPDFPSNAQLTLATDWDTYHSQALSAERTAWMIQKLGFTGRMNHYAGALWFYEMVRSGSVYASATATLTLTATANATVVFDIAPPDGSATQITHLLLPDDTAATVAQALAALVNLGSNLVWASASGNQLTLTARAMGTAGNGITATLDESSGGVSISPTSLILSGGIDATPYTLDPTSELNATLMAAADGWRTDLSASPRLNRAARDWHAAYFAALKSYGIDCVCSFSMEMKNADPSAIAGIAQCFPDSTPTVLNTPSVQTNFSTASLNYWSQVYVDMAGLQATAGLVPYLQFGEVQWWYFPNASGMPFYDAWTQQQFTDKYGAAMQIIATNDVNPAQYPNECDFLPGLIGNFTAAVRTAVKTAYPQARFEVLYPTDVNNTPLNKVINYPADDWTPANLTCLKTESFTFTGNYNLDLCKYSIGVSGQNGFTNSASSHLIGIGDAESPWRKEADFCQTASLESIVLFALDQYCLIGYSGPPFVSQSRGGRQG